MNATPRNRSDQSHQDLSGAPALAKIRELVEQAPNCFFCTHAAGGTPGARPMNVRTIDEQGNLWFLSADDSHKNEEIGRDPSVTLYFLSSARSDFLLLNGKAEVVSDPKKIKSLWEPALHAWFPGGADDPRLRALKVTPTDGHYWDTKHGPAIAGVKVLIGARLGKSLNDAVEGSLSV
jgi:general stress protein 26